MSAKNIIPTASNLWGKNRLQNILIPNWSLVRSTNTKGSQNVRKLYTMYSKSKANTPVNVFVAWLDRHVPLSVKILSSSPRRLSKLLFSFFFIVFLSSICCNWNHLWPHEVSYLLLYFTFFLYIFLSVLFYWSHWHLRGRISPIK